MSKEDKKIVPAIVHKVRWVSCGNKKFKSYIDYIDRDEATRNHKFDSFSLYNDYMGNPEKSGSLFTEKNDYMTQKEIKELKKNFELAQENKSMMWQDVFSFNNDWLIENGYLNPNTKVLDEAKIRNAIRKSMAELTKDGNENNLIWSASIHYNTEHIHVHVASVELKPNKEKLKKDFRERGKRKMKVIKTMKSKFINDLRNRDEFYQELDVLVRDNMVGSKKEYSFMKDRILREKMLDMLRHLPKDKREWNYERIKEAKPYVDSLSKYYVENFCRDDFQRFKKMVIEDRKEQLKIYGTPKDLSKLSEPHYKEADLYRRMGNTIIKELKEFVKEEEYKNKRLQYLKEKKKYKKKSYRSKKE
ncbi:MobP2 family relaxase, partial [Clostridium perfringens]